MKMTIVVRGKEITYDVRSGMADGSPLTDEKKKIICQNFIKACEELFWQGKFKTKG